jgi:hypothetical protein
MTRKTPLWVLHQIKLNTCAKQLTSLRHADDRVVDTVKQKGWRLRDFFDVGSGSRPWKLPHRQAWAWHKSSHSWSASNLLIEWATARIAGRHFGRGHASNVAHFLIRCVDDNRSLLFDNHVSSDDRGLARRENELSS